MSEPTMPEQAICPGCELRLMKADTSDGTLRMSLTDPTGAAQVLAETFAGALDKHGAKNYLEIIFIRPTDGARYVVTVQRPEGKTPHEIRADLEFRLTAYRGDLAQSEDRISALESDCSALREALLEACKLIEDNYRQSLSGPPEQVDQAVERHVLLQRFRKVLGAR